MEERIPESHIFDEPPKSWQDLQNYVAQTFREMGCDAETAVTKELPRGEVEFDVVVEDPTTAPHSLYVCECKQWSKRVPKNVVHGFRTVVSEIGANRGFIISRAGFQSGARDAAKFTNIDLLSWTQFESLMFDRWLEAVTQRLNPAFARVFALKDPNDKDLWKGYEYTEDANNELHRISVRYQLIIVWALLLWQCPGSMKEVVQMAPMDTMTESEPMVLDTYRKVVDRAPSVCESAYNELTHFWSTVKKATPRKFV